MALLGQGSSENLLIFAAALLIVLAGIIIIAGIGGEDAKAAESSQYWAAAGPISITEQVQRNDTLYLQFFNHEHFWMTIDSITVGGVTVFPNQTLDAGERRVFSVSGLQACSISYDSYEYQIQIIFSSNDLANQAQRGGKPLSGKCVY